MGRKGGKYKRKENSGLAKNNLVRLHSDDEDMMNDEIDFFHKNRDVVPLNISDNLEDSDEDNEQPVFDFKDHDEVEDEDDEDEDIDDEDKPPKGRAAKIARTQKYLRANFGGVEDELLDDANEEDQDRVFWGKKGDIYGTDVDYEPQSSDDAEAAEEELEVLKLQIEKAKVLSMVDLGLEDVSQDENEHTFEEILGHGKLTTKASLDKVIKDEDGMTYEIVKKDLNALTTEEQMSIVYSSAPELVALLSELNDALEQLGNKTTPFVDKIRGQESAKKGGMHYLEVKQFLLQSFCQAITFYLLLKSEGQPVRDHPVISRLEEIRSLLNKVEEMDEKLTFDVEDIVNKDVNNVTIIKLVEENAVLGSDFTNRQMFSTVSSEKQALVEPVKAAGLNTSRTLKNTEVQRKHQDKQVVSQSMEMLKIRASLEEKLMQKGDFSPTAPKNGRTREHMQLVNRQLETLDDFVDEAMEIDELANGRSNGHSGQSHSSKTSRQLDLLPNKRKVISGDDDIPKRDDIGERRRKHELRVLTGAGIKSFDDDDDVEDETTNIPVGGISYVNEESDTDSDLEYYKQVEREYAAKLAAKSNKYSRTGEVSFFPDTVLDGKRHITHQMEKNRGSTPARNTLTKNPRKNNRRKFKKAGVRISGQVRKVRKPIGHYGGEASGINADISCCIRLQN